MAKKEKRLVIQVQTRYGEGHPKEGQDAGFASAIASGKMVHFIHPGNEEIIKLYSKLAARKPGKRTATKKVSYINEDGEEIMRRGFMRIQRVVICYDPENFRRYETTTKKKRGKVNEPLVPICKVEVDGKELPEEDNLSENFGLSRKDFNTWFFKDARTPDYFEGFILHFTKSFYY